MDERLEGKARGRLNEGERNSIQSRNSIPPIQRNSIPPIQPNFYSKPAHTLLSFPQGPIPNKAQRLTRKFRASASQCSIYPETQIYSKMDWTWQKGPSSGFHKCRLMCDIPQTNTEFRIQNTHLHDLQRKSIQRDFVISWIPKKYLVASLSIFCWVIFFVGSYGQGRRRSTYADDYCSNTGSLSVKQETTKICASGERNCHIHLQTDPKTNHVRQV